MHVLRLLYFLVTPFIMKAQNRDTVFINGCWINLTIVIFARDRLTIIEQPFLIVDGVLQHQDGVVSVRAESAQGLAGVAVEFDAHDFY